MTAGHGTVGTAFRYSFGLRQGDGQPRTGSSSDVTVRFRNPARTVTTVLTVVEVDDGEYFVDLPASFTSTHGVGEYSVSMEVTVLPFDIDSESILFVPAIMDSDECNLNVSFVPGGTNEMRIGAWLSRDGVNVAAPTAIVLTWFGLDGTAVLFTLDETDAEAGPPAQNPDPNGRFRFVQTQALANDEVYKVSVAITDGSGTVTTFHDVQTVATA